MIQDDNFAFALMDITQDVLTDEQTIYCNEAWKQIMPILRQNNSGDVAKEAHRKMKEVAAQGGVQMHRGNYFRACFFRADAGVCACALQKLDAEN